MVDDDAEDRMILGEAFAELNCGDKITIYDSAFAFHKDMEALRILKPLPFLIVLDYNLPGADGAVLLGLLKNDPVLKTIPVVMYSTSLSPVQHQDCLAKGAVECYDKGATFAEVIAFAEQLCQVAFRERSAI